MKLLIKYKRTFILLILLGLFEFDCISIKKIESEIQNEVGNSIENSLEAEMEKHKKTKHKRNNNQANNKIKETPAATSKIVTKTNVTDKLSSAIYRDFNNTYITQDVATFRALRRKWDWKMLDIQLLGIYSDMNYQNELENNPKGMHAFMQIFVTQFEACDANADNVLNLAEFTSCLTNDAYLNTILQPSGIYAAYQNYTYTNSSGFAPILFSILDANHYNYLNFHDYMQLRLFAFSWRKCSVMAPFIEEHNFECAIEVASGHKTLPSSSARRIYQLGLELSNSESIRNLDFISYVLVATSVRLYGKINGKQDSDITRNEFNVALDTNVLPMRYNQDTVNQFMKLILDSTKPNQGIDLISFVFYDHFLRIYDTPQAGVMFKARQYYLSNQDFINTFSHYLFPNKTLQTISKIPQNKLSNISYQMYTYENISNFHSEADHFLKSFVETDIKIQYENRNKFAGAGFNSNFRFLSKNLKTKKAKDNILQIIGSNVNLAYSLTNTTNIFFSLLDGDNDGFINWYEYGTFIQIAQIFTYLDELGKGRIVAGDLYEKLTVWADYPIVSSAFRERAKRFNLFPQDVYFDLYNTLLVLRIDDMISTFTRRTDKTTLYEWELKNVFSRVNLRYLPDAFLNKCLRGNDINHIPLYDWECCLLNGVVQTVNYLESSYAYLTTKSQNLTLTNTVFVNTDPIIA